jgi:hypothetical protein
MACFWHKKTLWSVSLPFALLLLLALLVFDFWPVSSEPDVSTRAGSQMSTATQEVADHEATSGKPPVKGSLDMALSGLQKKYGPATPPDICTLAGTPMAIDLNDDGTDEVLVLFGEAAAPFTLKDMTFVRGFALFARAGRQLDPIFYVLPGGGTKLMLITMDGLPALSTVPSVAMWEYVWKWIPPTPDSPEGRWSARRAPIAARSGWEEMPRIWVVNTPTEK